MWRDRKSLVWIRKAFPAWAQRVIRILTPSSRRCWSAAESAGGPRVIIPRAPRHSCHQELAFRRIGEKLWSRGTIVNISKSGIHFPADREFRPPVAVELRFEFPEPVMGTKGARASGRAVIIRPAGSSGANDQSVFGVMYEDIWIDLRRIIDDDRGLASFELSMLPDLDS